MQPPLDDQKRDSQKQNQGEDELTFWEKHNYGIGGGLSWGGIGGVLLLWVGIPVLAYFLGRL